MDSKKLISVVVPIYNEIGMVREIYNQTSAIFKEMKNYNYELVFFDDGSTDGTREEIEKLCLEHEEVKCVFYARNFGYIKNTFYCMQQAKGDCAIILHADLQNPPRFFPQLVEKWENGAQVVQAIKTKSKENRFVYFFRTVFYIIMIHLFGMRMTKHATEFELFDKSFIETLKNIKTNNPFLRGIISEYATKIDYIYYTQDARKKGKSKFNINKYYDFAIAGITQFSRKLPRKVIFVCILSIIAIILESALVLIPEISSLSSVQISNAIIIRLAFFALALMSILISIVLEYIITLIDNSTQKPLIVEEKRIKY